MVEAGTGLSANDPIAVLSPKCIPDEMATKRIDWTAVEDAKSHDAFENAAWLTFYLFGDPPLHQKMRPALERLGARNLEGSEGGAVYAKVPVELCVEDIEEKIDTVRAMASEAGVEVDIIDLDSSSEVEHSKFFTLWNAG